MTEFERLWVLQDLCYAKSIKDIDSSMVGFLLADISALPLGYLKGAIRTKNEKLVLQILRHFSTIKDDKWLLKDPNSLYNSI